MYYKEIHNGHKAYPVLAQDPAAVTGAAVMAPALVLYIGLSYLDTEHLVSNSLSQMFACVLNIAKFNDF